VDLREGYITPLAEEDDEEGGSYLTINQQSSSWMEEQDQLDGWGSAGKQSFAKTPTGAKISPFIKTPKQDTLSTPTMTSTEASTPTAVDADEERQHEEALPTLDQFLSLDVALLLIHAARDPMKRLESFFPPPPSTSHKVPMDKQRSNPWSISGFPGPAGRKLRETLEEIFILLLIAIRERHLEPGFEKAIDKMRQYKPINHDPGTTSAVAPLLGFFELVHVGDTIGSMIQVYFDREMTPYIDVNDFLSGVMREKKKFENSLDEEVAKGLNAGTEVLMTQVEHVLYTRTSGREYCPAEGMVMDELGPTWGCKEVIECLEIHCRVVRGSTSREVLEVFYAEVGMRLNA
jgi:recyclin-1